MKLTWDEYRDDLGTRWVSMPFTIRAHGVSRDGQTITYRLQGGGLDSLDTDVDRLKREAEREAGRAAFLKRLGA